MNNSSYRGMAAPGAGGDPTRFPFMIEVNPWTPQDKLMEALLYRGSIVSAWGYMETWLREIAIRCSHVPEYRDLAKSQKYPTRLEDRLQYLTNVLNVPGPLADLHGPGLKFLSRFKSAAPLRNQMAHAHMRLLPNWGVVFIDIESKNGEIIRRHQRYSNQQLKSFALRATRLSRLSQRGAAVIDQKNLLPSVSDIAS